MHEKNCVQFQGYKKYNGSRVRNESPTAPKKFSGKSPGRIILYIEYLHILHILESMCDRIRKDVLSSVFEPFQSESEQL